MTSLACTIAAVSYADAATAAAEFWPKHNRDHGVAWVEDRIGFLARAADADADAAPIGAATAKFISGSAYLEQIIVADRTRGGGVGTALVSAFLAEARRRRCHVAELRTAAFQARAFYERFGFVVVATIPNSVFGVDHYWMQLRLAYAQATDAAP